MATNKCFIFILLLVLSNIPSASFTQAFTEVTSISDSLIQLTNSSVACGDYDNDGDLDILLAGSGSGGDTTALYKNNNGVFKFITTTIIGVSYPSLSWGDYDNDGDLDILLSGYRDFIGNIFKIYRNDSGAFVDIGASLIPVDQACSTWGDYDNDGDLDILISGFNTTAIYQNNSGVFTPISPITFGGSYYGKSSWGDFDNDGDLDIFLSRNNISGVGEIYRNDDSVFIKIATDMGNYFQSSGDWGDYDNDGDLDFLHVGDESGAGMNYSIIYQNNSGVFTDIGAGLIGVTDPSTAWGDYDNDGDLDILLTGVYSGSSTAISKVYRNDGGSFTDISAPLMAVYNGSSVWVDFDNDGDLDILMTGLNSGFDAITKVYRNNLRTGIFKPNSPPNPLTTLTASSISDTVITFSWEHTIDTITPSLGISYRLWISTSPDSFNISSSMADTATGWRRIAVRGNIQDTTWTLQKVIPGQTYFACVSAIDNGFMGSRCSGKISFLPLLGRNDGKLIAISASPNPTTDYIKITIPDDIKSGVYFSMFSASGAVIEKYSGICHREAVLDLTSLPGGIYFLRLNSNELREESSIKIIKE